MVKYRVELGNYDNTLKKIVYSDHFANGVLFSDIVEQEKYSLKEGFSYGSKPTTNTLKVKISGTQAQLNIISGYEFVRLYKNEALYFEGIFSSISKTIITSDFAEASITYKDYIFLLENVKFPSEVEYYKANSIKVSDPNDTVHSFIHIMFNLLFTEATKQKFDISQTNLFNLVCNYTDSTIIDYFSAGTSDTIYNVINDFLKEYGLGVHIHNKVITIIDVCSSDTGTATTIKDVEQNMTIEDKPYNSVKVAPVSIGVVKQGQQAEVVYVHEQNNGKGDRSGVVKFNFSDNSKIQALKYSNPQYSFDSASGIGGRNVIRNIQFIGSGTNWSVSYAVHNNALFKMHFTLLVRADVVYMEQDKIIHAKNEGLEDKNKGAESSRYIHTEQQAQRYMQALYISAMRDRKTYNFYADKELSIGEVVVINGLAQSEGVLKIIEKTDNNDDFGGFNYKAVNLVDASGITFDADYIPKSEELPDTMSQFDFSVSRAIIIGQPDGTPVDNTPVKVVIKPVNQFSIPTMTIENNEVELIQDTETLIDEETGEEYTATINQWSYNIPASLGGLDSVNIAITVGNKTEEFKVYKATGTSVEYGVGINGEYHTDITEWSMTQPEPSFEKPYIWQRTKTEGSDWVYVCLNSAQSALQSFTTTPQYVISSSEDHIADVPQTDDYQLTMDKTPLLDKSYYKRREVYSYYETEDTEPVEDKTYYILQGTEYIEADVSEGFAPDVTYYERLTSYEYDLAEDYTGFPVDFYENLRPYIWENDTLNWRKGFYVWQRNKVTYADGTVFYTEPYYDVENTQALLLACRFEIFADASSYEINKRASSNDYNVIQTKVFMKGYGNVILSSLVWSIPDGVTLDYSGDTCRILVPKTITDTELTIGISYQYKEGMTDTTYLILSATENTGAFTFLGNLSEIPTVAVSASGENKGALIDGDCYNLISNNNLVAYVRVNGSWVALGNTSINPNLADTAEYPQQVASCCNGYIESGFKGNGFIFSLGDCYEFLFAQQANIDRLASQKITLNDGGSIKSEGYIYGEGGSFDLGIKGFYISADGVAEFVSVRMKNSIVSGKFIHDALETVDPSQGAEVTGELDDLPYYSHTDAFTAIRNALPNREIVDVNILYKGVSYPKAIRVDSVETHEVTLKSGESWTNNTGTPQKIRSVTGGAISPDVNAVVDVGERVSYAGWDISTLESQITTKDSFITATGTYNNKSVTNILNANNLNTQSAPSGSKSDSGNNKSGSYTFAIGVKRQTITIKYKQAWSYNPALGCYHAPGWVKVNGTTIINATVYYNDSSVNPAEKSKSVTIKGGDVVTWRWDATTFPQGTTNGTISFSWASSKFSDIGFVQQGLYFNLGGAWTYIGQTGTDTNVINLTKPVVYQGNPAVFTYSELLSVGVNLCDSDGNAVGAITDNDTGVISSLDIEATYQGVDLLSNVLKYYNLLTLLQDDDDAPAFDAKFFDRTAATLIKWVKFGSDNNPNITASTINQFSLYWNGTDTLQIFRDNEPVYVISATDFVTSDFSIQFTPFANLSRLDVKDILPKDNGYYDLGSAEKKFRTVYTEKLDAQTATLEDSDYILIEKADSGLLKKIPLSELITKIIEQIQN